MLSLITFDATSTYKGIKTFDCSNEMINNFVHKSLKKRVKKHLSQAYVLLDEKENFVGFYTLDTFSINREIFEHSDKPSGLPPIVPVIKLGMLGLDISLQKQGIGLKLLQDALLKVVEISKIAGCTGLYLLAEVEAVSFYEKLGFIPLKSATPLPMFLHIEKILQVIDE